MSNINSKCDILTTLNQVRCLLDSLYSNAPKDLIKDNATSLYPRFKELLDLFMDPDLIITRKSKLPITIQERHHPLLPDNIVDLEAFCLLRAIGSYNTKSEEHLRPVIVKTLKDAIYEDLQKGFLNEQENR